MTVEQIVTLVVIIAAIIAAIVFAVVMVRTNNYKMLAYAALELVAEAEEKFAIEGQKTGLTKYGWVAKQLVAFIPDFIKPFVPASAIEVIIETAVEKLKEQLENEADS